MDYKKHSLVFYISALSLVFYGCSDKQKMTSDNTYYVEVVSSSDSLKTKVVGGITGKISYYKNNQLQIVSLNYVTEDHPDMHYFKNIAELDQPVKKDTKKILITFAGNFTYDSTLYSIERFAYNAGKWNKISDLGFIKAITTNLRAVNTAPFEFNDLSNQVVKNIAASTY